MNYILITMIKKNFKKDSLKDLEYIQLTIINNTKALNDGLDKLDKVTQKFENLDIDTYFNKISTKFKDNEQTINAVFKELENVFNESHNKYEHIYAMFRQLIDRVDTLESISESNLIPSNYFILKIIHKYNKNELLSIMILFYIFIYIYAKIF